MGYEYLIEKLYKLHKIYRALVQRSVLFE